VKQRQVRLGLRVVSEEQTKTNIFLNNDAEFPLLQPDIVE